MDFNCGSWKVIVYCSLSLFFNYVYGEKSLRKHSFRDHSVEINTGILSL